MHESSTAAFQAWANFAVIVGSSAAALTGLMFVVITMVAGVRARTTREGIAAFSTPTVVEFCAALLIGAMMTVPWPTILCAAGVLAIAGALGLYYSAAVVVKERRNADYEPDLEDTISYIVAPIVLFAIMLIGALLLAFATRAALFVLAASSLAFIFLGIHNAWDVVTYVGLRRMADEDAAAPGEPRTER